MHVAQARDSQGSITTSLVLSSNRKM